MKPVAALALIVAAAAASGCEAVKRVAIAPFYRHAALPDARIARGIAYVDGPGAHPVKHRLDLFVPDARGFTTVVFIHGGNWIEGDKSLHVSGADLYGNIGRFLAANGYGAAIVNYRLIPEVRWEAQPADIARAVRWVRDNIAARGGDPGSIVLMGHSAGAHLAALVAADPRWLAEAGVPREAIAGVAAVSGAGYDIADQLTYRLLGHDQQWFARRFHTDTSPEWAEQASPVRFIDSGDPPFLIMFATGDPEALRRQSALLAAALDKHGVWNWVAPISGLSHSGMVIVVSRADRAPGLVLLRFLGQLSQHRR